MVQTISLCPAAAAAARSFVKLFLGQTEKVDTNR